MNNKSNFRRGSVELLILHLLSQQDYYGYEISTLIRHLLICRGRDTKNQLEYSGIHRSVPGSGWIFHNHNSPAG